MIAFAVLNAMGLAFAIATGAVCRRLTDSAFGRVLQAIRENEFRAEAIGYRVVVYRTLSSVLSALFACMAGAMLALWLRYNGPDTSLSFEIMMDVLLIVVIGGMGTMYGAAIGSVLFLVAQSYLQDLLRLGSEAAAGWPWLAALLSPDRWMLWLGLLFVLSVYHFPTGVVGRLRQAALLAKLRSPPKSRVASSNTRSWCSMPRSPSASLKWVMCEISSTCGKACKRAQADRYLRGAKPNRFMPELSLRKIRCGAWVLCWLRAWICSSTCTVCHRPRREHSSKSRGSNTPSSNNTGPRHPAARTRSASFKSNNALQISSKAGQLRAALPNPPYTIRSSGRSATSGSKLLCNMRYAAS
mgnify:CR=1 FL=1